MKVEYVHASEPERKKIYDTDKAYENNLFATAGKTKEEWAAEELDRLERDKQRGLILEYKVLEERKDGNI